MCLPKTFYRGLLLLVILKSGIVLSAPLLETSNKNTAKSDVEKYLDTFLEHYYDEYFEKQEALKKTSKKSQESIYDVMQGDQPATENNINQNSGIYPMNGTEVIVSNPRNITELEYIQAMKNKSKENWIQIIKDNILRQIGRGNGTFPKPDDARLSSINMTDIIPNFLNSTNLLNDDQITEKIRSFYPSCEVPVNTDQDMWKDEDIMNLYFNFDYVSDERTNIATATLRLYRLPENGTKLNSKGPDCDHSNSTEDEKLLRVSIYWYTKSLKKKRAMKRRLSDSKVIAENARWVELSIKPATKAWIRGRNLGLGVLVEDQEGNTLKADQHFKGTSCTVGESTPKPIPTIIVDAARKSNELDRFHSLFGRNTTAAVRGDVQLLPTIDVCTLEFPENYTKQAHQAAGLRINACNLRKLHEQNQRTENRERLERLAALPDLLVPSPRHIRHQRQHLAGKMAAEGDAAREFDPRSRIVGSTVVITNEELQRSYAQNKFNFSTVNR